MGLRVKDSSEAPATAGASFPSPGEWVEFTKALPPERTRFIYAREVPGGSVAMAFAELVNGKMHVDGLASPLFVLEHPPGHWWTLIVPPR